MITSVPAMVGRRLGFFFRVEAGRNRLASNGLGQMPGALLPNPVNFQPYADQRYGQDESEYDNTSTNFSAP
jgi:hypothetical protein